MKKILSSFAFAALLLGSATPAFAAMPNYIGSDYKQPANCRLGVDHSIFELVNSNYELTGCLTPEAVERANALAQRTQIGIKFGIGQSVTLKTGKLEFCPDWYPQFSGCVIASELVR